MNNDSIRLHKEYGLNPTIARCVFCGSEKDEIVCLGASYPEKAPKSMVVDYTPCKACEKQFKKGGTIFCIDGGYAAFTVVTEEAFMEFCDYLAKIDGNNTSALEKAKRTKQMFLDKESYESLFSEEDV